MAEIQISVVICAYTGDRWRELVEAVASVRGQTLPALEVIVVIDHNPPLLARARRALAGVVVVENHEPRGLSGARNSGVASALGDVVAFIDDDAVAEPDWLERLAGPYREPRVVGVGGAIEPQWVDGRPAGFPAEFLWVVGCTYEGVPTARAAVRNMIGANMSARRELFAQVGGFRDGIGRVGRLPTGCEETELCIRARQRLPDAQFIYEPGARVTHKVPPARATWAYFRSRCFAEGLSKAQVSSSAGRKDGLASERAYVLRTLPAGMLRGFTDAVRGDTDGLVRLSAILAGLVLTIAGYLVGTLRRGPAPWSKLGVGPIEPDGGPVRVLEVDLSEGLPSIADTVAGRRYRGAQVLVRVEGEPVGMVSVELGHGGMSAQGLAQAISRDLAGEPEKGPGLIRSHHRTEASQRFSVVIPTHDRPDRLRGCIDSILAGMHQDYEIVVVDNAPRRPGTAAFLRRQYRDDARVRWVAEPRPGAVRARAAGLATARGEFVAFVDDDVVVDRMWLTAIARAFSAAEDVAAVTTLILPSELETPAQRWLEQFGGYEKGFRQRVFDRREGGSRDGLYPYSAGTYGSGASMAFRTRTLRELGGFDSRLSVGGEDLDLFLKVILSGQRLVYEPAAIAWHKHPSDYQSLRRTVFRYGAGLAALMTKWFFSDPAIARDIAVRLPAALRLALDPRSRKNAGKLAGYPRELTRLELAGMLAGPLMFAHCAWKARTQDAR